MLKRFEFLDEFSFVVSVLCEEKYFEIHTMKIEQTWKYETLSKCNFFKIT